MKNDTLGGRIKALRKREHMSQAELAAKIGVSPSAIGMYEQSRRTPDNETLKEFCKIFNVTSDYLIGLTDNTDFVSYENIEREYDVSEVLDDFTKKLSEQDSLMFDGQPLTQEEKEQVFQAINYVARIAEKLSTE